MKKSFWMALAITAVSLMLSGCSAEKALTWVDPNGINSNAAPKVTNTNTTKRVVAPASINDDGTTRRDNVQVEDDDQSLLKAYNVVVGAFGNKANALNYKNRMISRGYAAFLVKNAGGLYRVVSYASDDANDAINARNTIRATYASDGANLSSAAWILIPVR